MSLNVCTHDWKMSGDMRAETLNVEAHFTLYITRFKQHFLLAPMIPESTLHVHASNVEIHSRRIDKIRRGTRGCRKAMQVSHVGLVIPIENPCNVWQRSKNATTNTEKIWCSWEAHKEGGESTSIIPSRNAIWFSQFPNPISRQLDCAWRSTGRQTQTRKVSPAPEKLCRCQSKQITFMERRTTLRNSDYRGTGGTTHFCIRSTRRVDATLADYKDKPCSRLKHKIQSAQDGSLNFHFVDFHLSSSIEYHARHPTIWRVDRNMMTQPSPATRQFIGSNPATVSPTEAHGHKDPYPMQRATTPSRRACNPSQETGVFELPRRWVHPFRCMLCTPPDECCGDCLMAFCKHPSSFGFRGQTTPPITPLDNVSIVDQQNTRHEQPLQHEPRSQLFSVCVKLDETCKFLCCLTLEHDCQLWILGVSLRHHSSKQMRTIARFKSRNVSLRAGISTRT